MLIGAQKRITGRPYLQVYLALALGVGFLACSGGGAAGKKSSITKQIDDKPNLDLADTVNEVFESHCLGCHGDKDSKGGVGNILDVDQLIDQELLVPGKPKRSPIYKSMKDGSMPPNGDVTEGEIELVAKWITKGAIAKESDEKRDFVPESAVYTNAASDLLENFDESERPNVRYFSLIHLYNGGVPQTDIQVNREALFKLVNSLSSVSSVVKLKAIDNFKTLYRLELSDIGWSAKHWEDVIRSYPFLVIPDEDKSLGVLQADTGTKVPLIKADWFVASASAPPLYYSLLGLGADLRTFEQKIGVTLLKNVRDKAVMRAGFDNSLPSEQNRVIERHSTTQGFLWRSYEFETSEGPQNIFENPMGPANSGFPKAFRDDGGEFVFTLKNGFLAFYVFGRDGNRINEAPSKEGEDPIIAGQSCMSCHGRGLINKADMVREEAEKLGAGSDDLNQIYATHGDFKEQIEEDSVTYRDALEDAGVDSKRRDPVFRVAKKYELDVGKGQAAAELGVTKKALNAYLDDNNAMADIFKGGSIDREAFEKNYNEMSKAMRRFIK